MVPNFDKAALAELTAQRRATPARAFGGVTEAIQPEPDRSYALAVVDEAQDLEVPEAGFLAAAAGDKSNGLFFAGDIESGIVILCAPKQLRIGPLYERQRPPYQSLRPQSISSRIAP